MSTKINSINSPLSTALGDNSFPYQDAWNELFRTEKPLIRTYYDGLQPVVSDATATIIDLDKDPSMTKEAFADECDINAIMERFALTGEITHVNKLEPRYGDWSVVPEYQNAVNLVIQAREDFDALPAKIRERFHNSPESFLKFVSNPDNAEEMYSLGILNRQEASPDGVGATPEASVPTGSSPSQSPRPENSEGQ